jgi:quinol-cytochrome oxidoreductase complex cytochrome b subunit/Pyruvate/2-oxoacid:ferredoxin oxidoreductase delta subunit/coenzyme F420-reducing hydrogenase delta subunit
MEMVSISPTYRFMQRISYALSGVFSSRMNPMYYLGAITVFLLVIDVISGIYLFFFYEVDPKEAYDSVERISSSFLGSLMRSVHRYSSDGLILFAVLHMLHMILTDRFRLFRWVAWVSGVSTLIIFWAIGVSGYLLVWDERAQLIGILTAKFFSVIPIFGHTLMGAFLGTDVKNLGGLFRILLFGHIAVTILLVFTLWVHVMRISRPRIFPPKYLMVMVTVYVLAVSVLFPARSDPPADLGKVPFSMSMDWFYLTGYPLFKVFPLSVNWFIFLGLFGLLAVFPWIIKGRRNPPAQIVEDKCEGCEQCFIDCPYEAIYMKRVEDKKKAVVIEDKCAGCGICIASCNYNASTIPTVPFTEMVSEISEVRPDLVVFRCPFSAEVKEKEGVKVYTLPCAGSVNAVWMREILKITGGVLIVTCDGPDCYFREGTLWTEERFLGKRRPRLLKTLPRGKVRILEAPNVAEVEEEVEGFLEEIREGRLPEDVRVLSRSGVRHVLAWTVLLVPFLTFYPLTVDRMSFYPEDKALLVLTFKYRSSPVRKVERVYSKLKHMQAVQSIAVERSPIEVVLTVDDREVLRKIYNPRGLRRDASIYVYEEFLIRPGVHTVRIHLRETAHKDKVRTFTLRSDLKPSSSLALTYSEDRGFFEIGGGYN